ncbi:MAG: DUF3617 family protein [Steroidobacteraceae bacterium]
MKPNIKYVVLATLACTVAGMAALAQQKVPGEKWRTKVAMETQGFSMPARTIEMCLPKGQPEAAMHQQDNSNCAVSNLKTVGNKTSADIKCSGKDAMEGHMEMERLGEKSMRGSMDAKTGEMAMKMKYEYTALGEACEAVDYSNYKPPVVNLPKLDACQLQWDDVKDRELSRQAMSILQQYPSADGKSETNCLKHPAWQGFCAAVQTPAGFADLEEAQWRTRGQKAPGPKPNQQVGYVPLTESMRACGLGTGDAAITKLQKQVMATAEANKQYGFLLFYGSEQYYPQLAATAKTECSGRSFTNAKNKDYLNLCRNYGVALVKDNRAGAMEAAGCSPERVDAVHGVCIGATSGSGSEARVDAAGSAGVSSSAASSGAAGSAQPDSASGEAEKTDKSTKDKAKDALDKGKKALRGLLGGG